MTPTDFLRAMNDRPTLADALPTPDDLTSRRLLALLHGRPEPATEFEPTPPKPTDTRCALYRHFDADGVLLYVGISSNPTRRNKDHAKGSRWQRFAQSYQGEWFDTREDAERAEREAIRNEAPVFNRIHADVERDMRATAYLIEAKAWDLLRAAI